jgi:hypothetical protein
VENKLTGLTSILAAVIAFAVTGLSGIWLVPYLKKLKLGQTIRDVGPTWHKKKAGHADDGRADVRGGHSRRDADSLFPAAGHTG